MQPSIGQPAPDFTLQDQNDQSHTLSDYQGNWVVLYFYPKDDTPGCTEEACNMRDSLDEFQAHQAVVLGISADDQLSHRKFATKHNLNFPLLADTSQDVVQAYGVWQQKSMFGKTYMGINRQTFLIDPQGNIAKVYPDVDPTHHTKEILEDLQRQASSNRD